MIIDRDQCEKPHWVGCASVKRNEGRFLYLFIDVLKPSDSITHVLFYVPFFSVIDVIVYVPFFSVIDVFQK